MDFKFLELLGLDGFSFALIVAVLGFFWKADEALSTQFRADIGRAITESTIPADRNIWFGYISQVSEALLGKGFVNYWASYRLFIFASFIFILSTTIVLRLNEALSYKTFILTIAMYFYAGVPSIFAMSTIISAIVKNFLYHVTNGGSAAAYFILSLGASWLIMQLFQISMVLITIIINYFTNFWDAPMTGAAIKFILTDFQWNGESIHDMQEDDFLFAFYSFTSIPILTICLLPSLIIFVTSAGLMLTQWASNLNRTKGILTYALPVDDKPIRAIGIVVAMVMTLIAIVFWLIG